MLAHDRVDVRRPHLAAELAQVLQLAAPPNIGMERTAAAGAEIENAPGIGPAERRLDEVVEQDRAVEPGEARD
jgi:hypothetical protein